MLDRQWKNFNRDSEYQREDFDLNDNGANLSVIYLRTATQWRNPTDQGKRQQKRTGKPRKARRLRSRWFLSSRVAIVWFCLARQTVLKNGAARPWRGQRNAETNRRTPKRDGRNIGRQRRRDYPQHTQQSGGHLLHPTLPRADNHGKVCDQGNGSHRRLTVLPNPHEEIRNHAGAGKRMPPFSGTKRVQCIVGQTSLSNQQFQFTVTLYLMPSVSFIIKADGW